MVFGGGGFLERATIDLPWLIEAAIAPFFGVDANGKVIE